MNLKSVIGLGIAGNFTGHLEQAGEASDFMNVKVLEKNAPKGLFPFYIPTKTGSFLEIFPISSSQINQTKKLDKLQAEPEVALICDIQYENEKVSKIIPKKFTAYNDCSIRNPGAKKISVKKNWGINSKGISDQFIEIDKFAPGGIMDSYRIACYLKRNNELNTYGVDSAINGYSYFYQKLLDWIVEKMNTQVDGGPLESISALLTQANYPKQAIISIGATRYTEYGEKTFLKKGDEVFVILYNSKKYNSETIKQNILDNKFPDTDISVLYQKVI